MIPKLNPGVGVPGGCGFKDTLDVPKEASGAKSPGHWWEENDIQGESASLGGQLLQVGNVTLNDSNNGQGYQLVVNDKIVQWDISSRASLAEVLQTLLVKSAITPSQAAALLYVSRVPAPVAGAFSDSGID